MYSLTRVHILRLYFSLRVFVVNTAVILLLCVDWDVDQQALGSLVLNGLDGNLNAVQGKSFFHGEVCIKEKYLSPHGAVLWP